MNKITKKFTILAVILSMVVCFTGCGNIETNPTTGNGKKINITDISWNVDEGIVDGDRYVLLNYTNNTQYTITSLEITFKEKTDITEDEKETFYSDIQQKFEVGDEDMETIKSRPISMHAETDRVVNPGESVSNINCYYYRLRK